MRTRTPLRRLVASGTAAAALLALPIAAAAIPTPRSAHTATLLSNSSILIAGGVDALGNVLNTVEIDKTNSGVVQFTGANDVFVANMNVARASHTATFMPNGDVLVAGGINGAGVAQNTVEVYDPPTNTWTLIGTAMSAARYNHTATLLLDGRVLICGGQDQAGAIGPQATCDTFTPTGPGAGTLTAGVASLLAPRALHTAVLLKDGTVWFAGGWNPNAVQVPGNYYTTAERFYPTGNFFSETAPLNEARAYHSATVMGDGRVEVAGGYNGATGFNGILNSTEIYDPVSNTVTPSASMLLYRMQHSATLLPDGNVDFVGGWGTYPMQNPYTVGTQWGAVATINPNNVLLSAMSINMSGAIVQIGVSTTPITGTVVNLQMNLGSVQVVFTSGTTTLDFAPVQLQGLPITCNNNGQCGFIIFPVSDIPLTVTGGGTVFTTPPAGPFSVANQPISFPNVTFALNNMIVGTQEDYIENKNQTILGFQSQGRFGQTATLVPSGDIVLVGGRQCNGPLFTCGALTSINSNSIGGGGAFAGMRSDSAEVGPPAPTSGGTYFNTVSASLATARAYHTATMLTDGTILVAGGENVPSGSGEIAPLSSAELFNPQLASFATVGQMSLPRSNHTATLLVNRRVLIAGGFTEAASTSATSVAEIYYPDTKIFEPTEAMIAARANHTATLLPDGSVLVLGGEPPTGGFLASGEIYSSSAAAWSSIANMPAALAYHTATLLKDGRVLVIGGLTAFGPSAGVYAYTPATNSWATLASLTSFVGGVALYQHTATELFDGRVLVAGGNNGVGEYDASYYYDPVANAWSVTHTNSPNNPSLTNARFGHTATLLPNDTIMISGGYTVHQAAPIAPQVEIFHVDVSTWEPIGPFSIPLRAGHTMTLANNGQVYAIGGENGAIGGGGTTYLNSAESTYFTYFPDVATSGAPPSLRQSTITAITAYPFLPAANLTVGGNGFEGGTEASGGGAAAMNSAFSFPHLVLQQFGGSGGSSTQSDPGFVVDLTTAIYANFPTNLATLNTQLIVPVPASPQTPFGWYTARTGANDVYANGLAFQVGPPLPAAAPATIVGTLLGVSSISWTWSAVGGPIGGYDIYQASSAVFIGTQPVTSTTFVQTGLAPNTTGSVQVAAYTLSGDGPLIVSTTFFTLAAPPSLVQLSSVTPSSILVQWNWNGNSPGTIYEVDMSTDDFVTAFSTPIPASLDVTTTSVVVSGLQPTTTYYFRMRAFNESGSPSGFSAPIVSTETTGIVSAPSGVALSPTEIQWSWGAPTGGASSYDIYVASTGVLLGTSLVTSFFDTGLGTNTARQVLIGAVTGAGLGPLTPSTTVYTLANIPGPAATPPFIDLSTGGFVAAWANNTNPPGTDYQVVNAFFVPSGGVDVLAYTTSTTNNLSFGYNTLFPSRAATVTVYALNGSGIPSAPFVLGSTVTLANAPVGLTIIGTTPGSITVTWGSTNAFGKSNSTSTYYEVLYSTDDFVTNIATAVPFALGENLSTAPILGLVTATTYWVQVVAENALGEQTGPSNTVSGVTNNGGAPPGELMGTLTSNTTSQVAGVLGNGEYVSIASPSGAFPTDVVVTISSYNVAAPICPGAVNIAVMIVPNPDILPSRGLQLQLGYTLALLAPLTPANATIMRYVPSLGVCVPLNTTVNTTSDLFTAEINDWGIFVVTAPPMFTSANTARAFPNPYHVNHDGYVTIDQIPAGARVRVMDLRGDTVLDQTANGSGIVTWSATNGTGRGVSSGVYLVLVQAGSTQKVVKLAVVR